MLDGEGLFAEHSDREATGNFEDIDVVHNLESAVDVIRKSIKFAPFSANNQIQLHFSGLPSFDDEPRYINIRIGDSEGIYVHFECEVLGR